MRRHVVLAVLFALALVSVPSWSQFRGGPTARPSMPMQARAPAPHTMHSPGMFRGSAPHFGSPPTVVFHRGIPPGPHVSVRFGHRVFFHDGFGRRHFFSHNQCFNNPFVNPFFCQGFVASYPYFYAPGAYYDSGYSYPAQQDQAAYEGAALQGEVEQLRNEIARLREEESQRAYESQQRSTPPPPAKTENHDPPTTLVFRNGSRSQVRNYGIVGKTLWIFSSAQQFTRLPLDSLDLDATRKVNEEHGVEFLVPAAQ